MRVGHQELWNFSKRLNCSNSSSVDSPDCDPVLCLSVLLIEVPFAFKEKNSAVSQPGAPFDGRATFKLY